MYGSTNLKNIKISMFGWTSVIAPDRRGKLCCVLIKKNLFKGYTVVNRFNEKVTISSIEGLTPYIEYRNILKKFKVGRLSAASVREVQEMVSFLNRKHEQEITDTSNRMYVENEETLTQTQMYYESVLKEQEQKFQSEKTSEYQGRINFLNSFLRPVAQMEYSEEGVNIEYETPNSLQASRGFTSIPVRKPYAINRKYNLNMKEYLEYLMNEVEDEFKPKVKYLIDLAITLSKEIKSLSSNYNDSKYTSNVVLLTSFVNELRSFLILLKGYYYDSELSYYDSSSYNSQQDETVYTKRSVPNLISSGIYACSNLISNIYGQEESNKFLTEIEQAKDTVLETTSKAM